MGDEVTEPVTGVELGEKVVGGAEGWDRDDTDGRPPILLRQIAAVIPPAKAMASNAEARKALRCTTQVYRNTRPAVSERNHGRVSWMCPDGASL